MLEAIGRSESLVQQVTARLKAEINTGRFEASSRLPSEQVLAQRLGVSRPVVREAISQLRADGVLTTRKGSGAYVADNPAGNVFRLPALDTVGTDLRHLFELRLWTEVAAAGLAATRCQPEDLIEMRRALRQMEDNSGEFDVASAADVALHHAIARATKNPYLVAFSDFLSSQLLKTREMAWRNSALLAEGPSPAQSEHQAVVNAIAAKNPAAARAAALTHLQASSHRMGLDAQAGGEQSA